MKGLKLKKNIKKLFNAVVRWLPPYVNAYVMATYCIPPFLPSYLRIHLSSDGLTDRPTCLIYLPVFLIQFHINY